MQGYVPIWFEHINKIENRSIRSDNSLFSIENDKIQKLLRRLINCRRRRDIIIIIIITITIINIQKYIG